VLVCIEWIYENRYLVEDGIKLIGMVALDLINILYEGRTRLFPGIITHLSPAILSLHARTGNAPKIRGQGNLVFLQMAD